MKTKDVPLKGDRPGRARPSVAVMHCRGEANVKRRGATADAREHSNKSNVAAICTLHLESSIPPSTTLHCATPNPRAAPGKSFRYSMLRTAHARPHRAPTVSLRPSLTSISPNPPLCFSLSLTPCPSAVRCFLPLFFHFNRLPRIG